MLNQNFVFLGILIQSIGGISYLLGTLKGKIKPNKVSWLLWTATPLIAFVAEIKQGVGIQSLSTFIVGFIPLLVFIASFFNKQSAWKISRLDVICGILSFAGIILWAVTRVGNIAILFSILADMLAVVPTAIKSFNEPASENDLVYLLGAVSMGITLLTIRQWNFQTYGFPAYIFIANLFITILIRFKVGKLFKKV